MRRTVIFLLILMELIPQDAKSQNGNIPFPCGTTDESPSELLASEKNHCFTVSEIQSSCTKLWLKVNFHFFVDTDCTGTLDPREEEDIPLEDAYEIAEDLIDRANIELDENYPQWNQTNWGISPEKPAQCVPFRYVLSGVYIHCNTTAKQTGGNQLSYFQNNFGVNTDTEYNAYFVNHPSATGQANGIPGNSFTSSTLTNNPISVINHEMGHVLDLRHSHISDGVTDTPEINFQYDYNCNGSLADNYPGDGVGFETERRQCYFYYPDDPNPSIDYDGDGIVDYLDYCDIPDPACAPYPCCDWMFINNNIMAYSSYNECCAAYTEGQITRILDNLSTDQYCEYIESITDDICRPPMSNLHVLPNESVEEDCAYCFQLSASMHDVYYQLEFFTPSGVLQFSTSWRNGPASQYCISRSIKYATQYRHGFVPGVEYTAVLTTENDCGEEAVESRTFILPQLPGDGCDLNTPDDIVIKSLYPNPFAEIINVEYETERSGNLATWLIPATNGNDILLSVQHVTQAGTYDQSLNTQNIASGIYYLVLDLDGAVIGSTLLKI